MIADKTLTNVAPYNNFSPNRATTFPCFSLRPFTAPEIMPIEEKFANDTRKTEIIPTVFALKFVQHLMNPSQQIRSLLVWWP